MGRPCEAICGNIFINAFCTTIVGHETRKSPRGHTHHTVVGPNFVIIYPERNFLVV